MAKKSKSEHGNEGTRIDRIRRIIDDCLGKRAEGQAISDESLINAHGDLMPELAEELRKLRLIEAARLQTHGDDTTGDRMSTKDDGNEMPSGLHIRCPNCHNPVKITVNTPLAVIDCHCCGNPFRLAQDETRDYKTTPGTKLGHFELTERIGAGGFGTIFKARDTELDRIVAVKIPHKGHLDPAEIEQFLREARIAAQLKHPNIAGIHEVGREDDTVYIICDFVSGVPLSDWMTRRLTNREAAELCEKIARALHYAHQSGVIHRDLKPANIMINVHGEPCILDFGLAKREAGEITVTLDGQVMGTPAYMSPEQARGQAHESDRRTDIYSLGIILFELLTGELPFRGNEQMLIYQVINDEPASPRRLNANVPRDLETICLKCLEKDPQRRYESAKALADDLGAWLAGEPITARPVGNTERAWRWCRRKPAISALGATTVVLLAAIGLLATLAYFREARLRIETEDALSQWNWFRKILVNDSPLWQRRRDAATKGAVQMQDLLYNTITDPCLAPLIKELNKPQFHGKEYEQLQMRFQNHPARAKYQEVFNGLFDPNDPNLRVWSWFATGPNGLQLLRNPHRNETIGRNFAYRTYFTGELRDFKNSKDYFLNSHRKHVTEPYNLSIVMRPVVSNRRVVAISAPVMKDGQFLGVVGLMVEIPDDATTPPQ